MPGAANPRKPAATGTWAGLLAAAAIVPVSHALRRAVVDPGTAREFPGCEPCPSRPNRVTACFPGKTAIQALRCCGSGLIRRLRLCPHVDSRASARVLRNRDPNRAGHGWIIIGGDENKARSGCQFRSKCRRTFAVLHVTCEASQGRRSRGGRLTVTSSIAVAPALTSVRRENSDSRRIIRRPPARRAPLSGP